jgi:hypothetical protein
MSANTTSATAFVRQHTYAAGWNAACEGRRFDESEADDWKAGWTEANAIPPHEREAYLFNAEQSPPSSDDAP